MYIYTSNCFRMPLYIIYLQNFHCKSQSIVKRDTLISIDYPAGKYPVIQVTMCLVLVCIDVLSITTSYIIIQVNEKFFILKGIVEKAQETSSDSDMHNTVLVPLLYFMNSGCVLECRETPTSQVTI